MPQLQPRKNHTPKKRAYATATPCDLDSLPLEKSPLIRIACIGDSLTFGTGTDNPENESYPSQLSRILGPRFDVRNYGVPGSVVINNHTRESDGWNPCYAKQTEHQQSLIYIPNIAVINLGINEVTNENFDSGTFVNDYCSLINAYKALSAGPDIYIWNELAPLFPGHPFFNHRRLGQIQKALDQVVGKTGIVGIDMNTPLKEHGKLFPDQVHPNAKGAELIANVVFDALKPTVSNAG